jgi:glycolate oxidase FAD binding subunit
MTSATTIQPRTIEDVQAAVRENARLLPRGGGTKPGLSTPTEGVTALDMSVLTGVLEYNPNEFTFTALAGTRVAEVQAMLAEYGQYLPFDPPLADKGATLGGTVASGLSGPGRYRYGGARDFILGVRLVDGNGDVIRGGGKVVKNSAGFDIPKMMVGSLGQLGVLIETTFKVFPQSPTHITVRHSYRTFNDALNALYRLCTARLDVEALDLMPRKYGCDSVACLTHCPHALNGFELCWKVARCCRTIPRCGRRRVTFTGSRRAGRWPRFRSRRSTLHLLKRCPSHPIGAIAVAAMSCGWLCVNQFHCWMKN